VKALLPEALEEFISSCCWLLNAKERWADTCRAPHSDRALQRSFSNPGHL